MKKMFFFLLLTVTLSIADDNVYFRRAIPSITALSEMLNIVDFSLDSQMNHYFLDAAQKKIFIYDINGNLSGNISIPFTENPVALGLSTDNSFYILDEKLKKIFILDKSGKIVNSFGDDRKNDGSFENPFFLRLDEYDNIFVLDKGNRKLLKYNKDGLYRGSFTISNPKAVVVDREQIVHILRQDESGNYSVVNVSENLKYITEIKILNVFSPVDIAVNYFNEFYIVDAEAGTVIRYGQYGNVIGEQIGKKSSSKAPGQFSNPARIIYKYINNETESISILDSKFSLVQTFEITTLHERCKLKEVKPFLPVTQNIELSGFEFREYFTNGGLDFFISPEKSVRVFKEAKELFPLSHSSLQDIVGVVVTEDEIFTADGESNRIIAFDKITGKPRSVISRIFSDLTSIVSDSKNNIYVFDKDENDIYVTNDEASFRSIFDENKIPLAGKILSFTISHDDNLCIQFENDEYYYQYDLKSGKYSQVKLEYEGFGKENIKYTMTNSGILAIYNNVSGVVELFDDGLKIGQFLSRGKNENQMSGVTGIFFDGKKSELILSDNKSQVVKKYGITLPSEHNLRLEIDELGFVKLIWDPDNNASGYKIYRRDSKNKDYVFYNEVREPNFTIMEETSLPFEYTIRTVTQEGESEIFSNSIIDQYTYARTIRFSRPEEAIDLLAQYREVNPTNVDNQILAIYRDLVNDYRQKKKYELALKYISKMKIIKPQNYTFYIERSELLEDMQRTTESMEEIIIAKDKFTGNINIYYHLIRLEKKQGDFRGVITHANEALNLFPGDEKILASLANAYYELKIFNEAARYYRVLSQLTGDPQYSIQAGRILVAQKKYDEAFVIYNQMIAENKKNGPLCSAIAEAYLEKGEDTKAINEINAGLELEPGNSELYFLLGKIHLKQRDIKSAEKAFEKAVELDDKNPGYNLALGDVLTQSGRTEDAIYFYETAVLYSPENIDALLKLGSIYFEEGKIDYAYRHLARAYQLSPSDKSLSDKYNSVREKRNEINANREPVEFNYISLGEINTRTIETFNPSNFGSVTIFNTKNEAVSDILISIECAELVSLPILLSIPLLQPNEFFENYFDLKIEDELVKKLNGKSGVKITFNLTYNYGGESKTNTRTEQINVKN